jgi:hypothetical protein
MSAINWTTEAEAKLKEVPFWGRFLVRREVEKFAQGMDATEVNSDIYHRRCTIDDEWSSI